MLPQRCKPGRRCSGVRVGEPLHLLEPKLVPDQRTHRCDTQDCDDHRDQADSSRPPELRLDRQGEYSARHDQHQEEDALRDLVLLTGRAQLAHQVHLVTLSFSRPIVDWAKVPAIDKSERIIS